jgi:carbon monoxide dehydrogenase subunit G
MPTTTYTHTIAVPQQCVWDVLEDPYHMPRWWPGVTRMEGVEGERWTQVLVTKRGRPVRADFHLLVSEPPWRREWEQEVAGTPFERVLDEAVTEVLLEPVGGGTQVTIAQRQKLRGYSRTGGVLLRRATRKKLQQAVQGLERACGARPASSGTTNP